MFVGHRGKGFKGALHNALRADVDPTAGRHLAIHHQALAFEFVKMLPVGPGADEIGVGNQNSRRIFVSAKDPDGFA